jgi:hypothetical protein
MMDRNTKTPLIARFRLKAAPRFELGDGGFADLCLTTWLCCHSLLLYQNFGIKQVIFSEDLANVVRLPLNRSQSPWDL